MLRKHQLSGPGFGGHRAERNLRSEGGEAIGINVIDVYLSKQSLQYN